MSMKNQEADLESKIAKIQIELENKKPNDNRETIITKLEDLKHQLEKLIEYKTQGSIIRSKARWYNEGEKNTKYFLNLEKRHFNRKTIKGLKLENGTNIDSDKEILENAKSFYQKLYTSSKPDLGSYEESFFPENKEEKLSDVQKDFCEGKLKLEECLQSLKTMANNKSPGSDGLPAEFYKFFWQDIKVFLIDALNAAYKKGILSISQRRGLISLLPKKNKVLYYLKNWRPISLLNCDYKIAAKVIASRIKNVLPTIINFDQTGFLKGRSIGENVRLIDSIINFTKLKDIPGLLLFVDFEKAFDTLEWSFIVKTLKYYNFGPSLISWVNTLYCDASSAILNNGWSSGFFSINRGVRQGCPLSPYLFIVCAEVLGSAIRRDHSIRGIDILGVECKISQYADDTTLILDGSFSSLENAFKTLDNFALASGLKVNYEKSEALWIGKLRNSNETLFLQRKLTWARRKVKALGVWFSTIEGASGQLNFEEKIEKLKKTADNWQLRRLTLLGKITVIKSLLASQLVYILTPLPTDQKLLEEINRLLFSFLWDGKGDRIKRSEMINDYEKGGLKMLDIKTFNSSLKSSWIKKYLDIKNTGKWKLFFDFYLAKHGGRKLFAGNLNSEDIRHLNIKEDFLKEVLHIWAEINFQNTPKDFEDIPLWHNSLIRIGKIPVFFPRWSTSSVNHVKDLLDENSKFLTHAAFTVKYDLTCNFLEYYGLISAIQSIKGIPEKVATQAKTLGQLLKSNEFSKTIYKLIVQKKTSIPRKSEQKWERACLEQENININWEKTYSLAFHATKSSKLRTFQFKLLHRRIATNDFLFKIGIAPNNLCTFCKEHVETLEHIFWNCIFSQTFWSSVTDWIATYTHLSQSSHFSMSICLGLDVFPDKILINQALLIARYHIHVSRVKGTLPQRSAFIRLLWSAREIENNIAKKTRELPKFFKKWETLRITEQELEDVC